MRGSTLNSWSWAISNDNSVTNDYVGQLRQALPFDDVCSTIEIARIITEEGK